MLRQLKVRDIALIESVDLSFSDGLTALTGETGAGKTALLSALKLVSGTRADASMIREGAPEGSVEALFETNGVSTVVKRRFGRDGRSKCTIDGDQVSVGQLLDAIGPLIDLHAQHENQSLLKPATHLRYFEEWIGPEADAVIADYAAAFEELSTARAERAYLEEAARTSAAELEVQRIALREIETVSPSMEEYLGLQAEMPVLTSAEALSQAASTVFESLSGDGCAGDLVSEAQSSLSRLAGIDARGDALAERLEMLQTDLSDIASDARAWRDSLDFDPGLLQRKLERLSDLDRLVRNHGPRMEDVMARWDRARRLLEVTDTSEERLEEAERRCGEAHARLLVCADAVGDLHAAHADRFSQMLTGAVAALGMENARLMVVCTRLPESAWTADGPEQVELYYAPAQAVTPHPLARIASGGELSRVMLALTGTLVRTQDAVLVFDEVDTGIGGATARLVGERLKQIAADNQVVVVTHLPVIAACADRQFRVSKTADALPRTLIEEMAGEDRLVEIARMLSGTVDEAALRHAAELLDDEGTPDA